MDICLIGIIQDTSKNTIGYRILDTNAVKTMDVSVSNMTSVLKSNKATVAGIGLLDGKLVGTNGSLDRYPKIVNGSLFGNSSLTILNQIVSPDKTLGYTVCDWKGNSKRATVRDVINYASANGIANGAIKSLNGKEFISPIQGEYKKILMEYPTVSVSNEKAKEEAKELVETSKEVVREVNNSKDESKELDVMPKEKAKELVEKPIVPNIKELEEKEWSRADFKQYLIDNDVEYTESGYGDVIVTGDNLKVLKLTTDMEELYSIPHDTINVEEFIIPRTVNCIKRDIFPKLSYVRKIYIQDGNEKLNAYYVGRDEKYNKVQEIRIPNSMKSISGFAFLPNLTSIDLRDTKLVEVRYFLNNCINLNSIEISSKTRKIDCSFNQSNIEEIVIPEGVAIIEDSFNNCTRLKKIKLPKSLTRMGNSFKGCIIEDVDLSNCNLVTDFNDNFRDCVMLEKVILPKSMLEIGGGNFYNCNRLGNIDLENVQSVSSYSFTGTRIKEVIFGKGFKHLSNSFNDDVKVILNEEITSIPNYAFTSKRFIGGVEIRGNITEIGYEAFRDTVLKSLEIPKSLVSIGESAFRNSSNLKEFNFQDLVNLKEIKSYAFELSGIEKAILQEGLEEIGDNCFYRSKLKLTLIPKSVISIGKKAFDGIDSNIVYLYRGSYAEKYFKKNKLNYIAIDSLESFYEYTHEDRELSDNKERKLKLLISQNPMHRVLLEEPYKNKADLMYSLYTNISEPANSTDNNRLIKDKLINIDINALPFMRNIIDTNRIKLESDESYSKYSVDNLSPTFITLCNLLTITTSLNTAPFSNNTINYYNDIMKDDRDRVKVHKVYLDSCSSITSLEVLKDNYEVQALAILVEIGGKIVYTTNMDWDTKNTLTRIFSAEHYIECNNSIYNYTTPGDKFKYILSTNISMFGIGLPTYLAKEVAENISDSLLVGVDMNNDNYILMCKDNNKLLLLKTSEKGNIGHMALNGGREYNITRFPDSILKDKCSIEDLNGEWKALFEKAIVREKSNRFFAYTALGNKYTEKLSSLTGAYDKYSCYEWELGESFSEIGIVNVSDLVEKSLKLLLDSNYFIKTKKKAKSLVSGASLAESYCLKDGSKVSVYYLDKLSTHYGMIGYYAKYVTVINVEEENGFIDGYISNEKLSEVLLNVKVIANNKSDDKDELAIDDNVIDGSEFYSKYFIINRSSTYSSNGIRNILILAINKTNGGVYLVGSNMHGYCKLLRFKDIKEALKHTTFMCRGRDNISRATDGLLFDSVEETTRIINGIEISNDVTVLREDIINGYPNGHHTNSKYLDVFDSLGKQESKH